MSKRAVLTAAVRKRMPASTARTRARVGARLALRNDQVLQRARDGMRLLVGELCPDADLDALAREHVGYALWTNEMRWHRTLCRPLPVEGLERLSAVEGGAIISFLHLGPFMLIGPSLARSGREVHMMADPSLIPPQHQPWQRQVHEMGTQGCHAFSAAEGSAGIRRRLGDGAVVGIASDVPGHTPVRFLGRDMVGSSGAARVAWSTGAPVLCLTAHRDASGQPFFRLGKPLDPQDFDTAELLLQEMLRQHEEAVLAWPAAYHDPLNKWSLELPASTATQPTR